MAMSHRCRCPPHTVPQVVLFAVPGAFTPTCSLKHLPGFIEKVGAWESSPVQLDREACCVRVFCLFRLMLERVHAPRPALQHVQGLGTARCSACHVQAGELHARTLLGCRCLDLPHFWQCFLQAPLLHVLLHRPTSCGARAWTPLPACRSTTRL